MAEIVDVEGRCAPPWRPLRDAFRRNFEDGLEIGAALCVMREGEPVLDCWAGARCGRNEGPWEADTLVLVASVSKIPMLLATLMLVDRGAIGLDDAVAEHWPAFAAGGKEAVTVRDAMMHRAGVPGLREPLPYAALKDWELVTARIAAEPHWFPDERPCCYHPMTHGFLLGELIRRADGRMPDRFVADELVEPLGADFRYRLPRSERARRTGMSGDLLVQPEPGSTAERVFSTFLPPADGAEFADVVFDGLVPAYNGWSNARGMARLCALPACGGALEGRTLISRTLIDEARREQWAGADPVMGRIRYGLGFGLDSDDFPAPTPTTFHWGGHGGHWALMDPVTRVSAAYVTNHSLLPEPPHDGHGADPRQLALWEELGRIMAAL